ncbi:unnamed protein product [Porites lobata]|uniref:Uncharacterized protein n=1 Tax=Porites lobata TaxID=104759 RepID=A0ABN8N857_9CNID|nr:unnamed protein product [Porites lobata]
MFTALYSVIKKIRTKTVYTNLPEHNLPSRGKKLIGMSNILVGGKILGKHLRSTMQYYCAG